MTLNEIISIEPQIGSILLAAERHRGCGDWKKYEQFKRRLARHVGWDARRPELSDAETYETVVRALADALDL